MSTLAKMTVVFSQGGGSLTCGLDFESELGADWDEAALSGIADAFHTDFAAVGMTNYGSTLSIDHVEAYAYDLSATGAPAGEPQFQRDITLGPVVSTGAVTPGTVGSAQSPPNIAVVLSLYTTQLSRRGRGRIYTPPPPEVATDSAGEIDVPTVTDIKAGWVSAIEAAEGWNPPGPLIEHVVVSLMDGVGRKVTLYRMGDRIDTQRRRLQRGLDTYV